MEMGAKMKMLRLQLGLTLEEVGNRVGVGKSTVRKWENGEIANMRRDKIALVAKALNVSPAYLMGWKESKAAARIPVLGSIPAGVPLEAIEDIEDYEEIDAAMLNGGKEYFALKISGDSMAPNYLDGDVVILRVAEECKSGQDCAVMVNAEEGVFKRVKLMENGMMLHPLNPDYEPRFFTKAQVASLPVRILGVAIEIRRQVL